MDLNDLAQDEVENKGNAEENAEVGRDGRILHPDPDPDSTITERGPRRSERVRNKAGKARLNEQWQDPDNWGQQASLVVNKGYLNKWRTTYL